MRTTKLFLSLLLLALPASGQAVSITISGPASGPFTSGVGTELVTTSQVVIAVGLDASTTLSGYDLSIAWDPVEVALASASNLLGDMSNFSDPTLEDDPTGSRIAKLSEFSVATAMLFELTFDVLGLTQDGSADVSVFFDPGPNGVALINGLTTVPLDNPDGAGIDLIPEPHTGVLLALGLLGLAVRQRGGKRAGA